MVHADVLAVERQFGKFQLHLNQTLLNVDNFLSEIMISKIGVKINFRIKAKNHSADPEKEFLTKSISNRLAAQRPWRQRGG